MESKDYYAKILDKTVERNIPFKVFWELTYNCNLRCKHCYISPKPKRGELDLDEIKTIIDEIYSLGALFITFSGGEVLTRGDFFKVAEYARKKGFAIRIFTNGTLITPSLADRIKELAPLSVEISLYGMNPSAHDAVTKLKGSFDRTISAITLLKERDLEIVIKSPLMKDNFSEFNDLKAFTNQIDARFVFDLNLIPKEDGNKSPLAFRLNDSDLRDFFSSIDPAKYWKKREIQANEPICNAGLNSLSISPYGDVYPCVGIKKGMGSLRENSVEEIWNSPEFREFRSINKFSNLKKCLGCGLLSYCKRCPGVARLEDGDFFGPATSACRITKLQHSFIK